MTTVAILGLGYVGLPLVIEFGKHSRTIGFDIHESKVKSCQRGVDPSRELPDEEMRAAVYAEYSADPKCLAEATSSSSPCPRQWMGHISRIFLR